MVGGGRVGKNHARAMTRHVANARIVALVEQVPEVCEETAAEFGIGKQFQALEEALDKADFEAVVITTPTPTHLPLTALAASHKKHVFLEKPMALNLAECDAIISTVRSEGILLQLGFMRRFDPDCGPYRGGGNRPAHDDQVQYPRSGPAPRLGAGSAHLKRHAGRSE